MDHGEVCQHPASAELLSQFLPPPLYQPINILLCSGVSPTFCAMS
jgi:hypothetical protein